jgi:prepilin-type N-terminal cleavage/methylation domain-containing protein
MVIDTLQKKTSRLGNEEGFSLIELVIVMLVISILSVMTILSFRAEKKFASDDQAYLIVDIIQEARQRSLTQHETMRVEINRTRNTVRLINENISGDATDDVEIKTLKLQDPKYVVVDTSPQNISSYPTESSPVPKIVFKTSVHPLSLNDSVATLRFLKTGKVVDAGSNAIGDNAAVTGATIYLWMPNYSAANLPLNTGNVIRAITVLGGTGNSKYWKCPVENNQCSNWTQ